jgi:hypothetical protein
MLDIAQIPLNLDCWQHYSYIEKVYLHTLICGLVMCSLKAPDLFKFSKHPGADPGQQDTNVAARMTRQASKHLFSRPVKDHSTLGTTKNAIPEHTRAASVVQTLWRNRSPRTRTAWRNIAILRGNLLHLVTRAKHLGREDFLLLFSYAVYAALCDTCFMYFDCSPYEDGEIYLVPDANIKCTDDTYNGINWYYVALMSLLFPFGIPIYYFCALYARRALLNPPLKVILEDKDYVSAFVHSGRQYSDGMGGKLTGKQLTHAKEAARDKWVRQNSELAASLEGKDYKTQFELMRTRLGYTKAKELITHKAREASIPARKLKFLWGPYRVHLWYFEVLDMFRYDCVAHALLLVIRLIDLLPGDFLCSASRRACASWHLMLAFRYTSACL